MDLDIDGHACTIFSEFNTHCNLNGKNLHLHLLRAGGQTLRKIEIQEHFFNIKLYISKSRGLKTMVLLFY